MSDKKTLETPTLVEIMPQTPNFGNVTDLGTENFVLPTSAGRNNFVIKNENDDAIWLEVKPAQGSTFINTKFNPGWNPEIVKEIKVNTTLTTELGKIKWGY
jgi:hypothetical protein